MSIKLSTPVVFKDTIDRKIAPDDAVIGLGSCFTQSILNKLYELGFDGMINPNGIVYNTVSLAKSLQRIAQDIPYSDNEFFTYNNLWHSWEHHGEFSRSTLNEAKNAVNLKFKQFQTMMKSANFIVITLSSSVVYELTEDFLIVANCHKVPGNKFQRKLLTSKQNFEALRIIYSSVKSINPNCILIFTLSPVRHYKGDLQLNSVSKANLLSAIHEFIDNQNSSDCFYFPAFEIIMDELRDYRFYKTDMMHPSELAVDIIFNRFIENCMTPESAEKITIAQKKLKQSMHIG